MCTRSTYNLQDRIKRQLQEFDGKQVHLLRPVMTAKAPISWAVFDNLTIPFSSLLVQFSPARCH